ncbi:hypothetical protein B0O99DRAFT_50154 [Bisporella sp. PMI_857]|nr:hypothetical protein B0O99DRAFT_50154 [Bisporella sp. PMI_857]
MKYSTTAAMLFLLGSKIAHCGPIISRQGNLPTLQNIADAQNQWASDTSKVSQFLSVAESLNSRDLVSQAAIALANEKDELSHKAVLDNQFIFVSNPDKNVQHANNELVDQGTFLAVVNGLQALVDNGAHMSPSDVSAAIKSTANISNTIIFLPNISYTILFLPNISYTTICLLAQNSGISDTYQQNDGI